MLSHHTVELFARTGRVTECGLVGVGVSLLEEVYHWEWALSFQKSIAGSGSAFLTVNQGVALSCCPTTSLHPPHSLPW